MKKPSKRAVKERIERLINVALELSSEDLSKREAALLTALKLQKKHNVRGVPLFKRYFYCHRCKRVMIPGRTATIRINSGKVKALAVTCAACKQTYRIPLTKKSEGRTGGARCQSTSSNHS
jgi:RNase P subunit RPR2